MAVETLHLHKLHVDAEGLPHTIVIIFTDHESEWRCTAATCGVWVTGRDSATVSEWELICGDKFKIVLVQALFFAGCMIGTGIFGHLSDSFLVRKESLMVVCALNTIFGCLTTFSPNYWIYVILRFLTSFSTGGVGLCAFVFAIENIGPTKCGIAGMSTFYFFSIGIAILSAVAYVFQTWRELYIASSISSILFLILNHFVRRRVTEVMKIMSTIAFTNEKHFSSGVLLALGKKVEVEEEVKIEALTLAYKNNSLENKDAVGGFIVDMLRSPITRIRLILMVAISFFCAIVYYGLSLNVVNLDTNLDMNVVLNVVAEMPVYGITVILLDKFGRKPLAIGTMWFNGLFCLLVRMVCGILGIFGMAGTYKLLFIYTAELFPTVVKNTALGCMTQAGQIGAILSQVVVVLERLPFVVFAVCGIVGGMFAFYLPETLNQPLYDTFFGLEAGLV
ncbi:hypothetical protein AAHE18_02G113100 [Arachis hypogaea]